MINGIRKIENKIIDKIDKKIFLPFLKTPIIVYNPIAHILNIEGDISGYSIGANT